jgi:SNF2 family DNA or RNA helicase
MVNLLPHQKDVLNQTENRNRVAYYLDMGLGKTYVGSEKMIGLRANVNLIICQKSKVNDWVNHFKEHYAEYDVEDLTKKNDFETFIQSWNTDEGQIIGVINYELAFRRPELANLTNFTLMLDESSMIQNETAKRSKFILKKLKPSNVILLSGTPTSGKYERLWSQMHLLGWGISKKLYYRQYVDVEFSDDGYPIIKGYKNVDRLKQKMRDYGCVFMKSDEVMNLPTQNFIDIKVPETKEYKHFKKHGIVKFDDVELVGDTTLTKLLYSRMLCGAYNQDKLKAFVDLIDSTDDRVIVFYNFNNELESILSHLEKPYSVVNGKVKDLYHYENSNDSVTFIQYQAGAMGLNLQKSNKIIYFSPPLSSELFEQSRKRIHRICQEQPCFYYQIKCGIEHRIYDTLAMRRDYTDALFEADFSD